MAKRETKKSDVGFEKDILAVIHLDPKYQNAEVQLSKALIDKADDYKRVTDSIKHTIDNIFENYLNIGNDLNKVESEKLYILGDYANIIDYAMSEFDLSETTIRNVMNIVKRFCDVHGSLKEEYKGLKFSHLVELLPLSDEDLSKFEPKELTVKKIRNIKVQKQIEKKVNEFFEDGFYLKCVNLIKEYDYAKFLASDEFELEVSFEDKKYEFGDTYFGISTNFKLQHKKQKKLKSEFKLDYKSWGFKLSETRGWKSSNEIESEKDIIEFLEGHLLSNLKDLMNPKDTSDLSKENVEPKYEKLSEYTEKLHVTSFSNMFYKMFHEMHQKSQTDNFFIKNNYGESTIYLYKNEPLSRDVKPDFKVKNYQDFFKFELLNKDDKTIISGEMIFNDFMKTIPEILQGK